MNFLLHPSQVLIAVSSGVLDEPVISDGVRFLTLAFPLPSVQGVVVGTQTIGFIAVFGCVTFGVACVTAFGSS